MFEISYNWHGEFWNEINRFQIVYSEAFGEKVAVNSFDEFFHINDSGNQILLVILVVFVGCHSDFEVDHHPLDDNKSFERYVQQSIINAVVEKGHIDIYDIFVVLAVELVNNENAALWKMK